MNRLAAIAFIDSEIMTRKDYGMKLAAKTKPATPETVLQLECNRLQNFYDLRDAIKSDFMGEMNGKDYQR